jgi:hypothetical protein
MIEILHFIYGSIARFGWLNLPRDNCQIFYIFLWMIANLVSNQNKKQGPIKIIKVICGHRIGAYP